MCIRDRDNLAIITDDKDQLLRIISEKLDLASERIEFKEPLRMQVVDPKTIIAKEQMINPQETEKVQTSESFKQEIKSRETQNQQKQEPDKIQRERERERERGGRGR